MAQLEHIEAIEKLTKEDFSDKGAIFLREEAQFDYLVALKDSENRAEAIVRAMESIERDYETLRGVLPKEEYNELDNKILGQLLCKLNPEELKHMSGDVFDQAANELVKRGGNPFEAVTFYGVDAFANTIRLAKMNPLVHEIEGDIRQAISYYEDPHELIGMCDYVMAFPPFNAEDIDAEKIKGDPRLPFGLPSVNDKGKVSNGNYVWISYFYSYLKETTGKAGFVMAAGAEAAGRGDQKTVLMLDARNVYRKTFGDGTSGTARTKWDVKPLSEVADVLYGKDRKKLGDGQIPCYGSGGIMRYCDAAIHDRPSVLIPRKGSIGNVMFVDEPFWSVDTMFYTRVKISDMEHLLYYQLCDYNLASMSTGAAVPSMTTALLNPLEIVVPPEELRVRYSQLVQPMFDQKRQLFRQNAKLASARDILLPQLMSGCLRIDATTSRGKKVVS